MEVFSWDNDGKVHLISGCFRGKTHGFVPNMRTSLLVGNPESLNEFVNSSRGENPIQSSRWGVKSMGHEADGPRLLRWTWGCSNTVWWEKKPSVGMIIPHWLMEKYGNIRKAPNHQPEYVWLPGGPNNDFLTETQILAKNRAGTASNSLVKQPAFHRPVLPWMAWNLWDKPW